MRCGGDRFPWVNKALYVTEVSATRTVCPSQLIPAAEGGYSELLGAEFALR